MMNDAKTIRQIAATITTKEKMINLQTHLHLYFGVDRDKAAVIALACAYYGVSGGVLDPFNPSGAAPADFSEVNDGS